MVPAVVRRFAVSRRQRHVSPAIRSLAGHRQLVRSTLVLGGGGATGGEFAAQLQQIDEALVQVRTQVRNTLAHGGLNEQLADILIDYVDTKVSTEKALADIVGEAQRQLAARRDPAEALSAAQLAAVLGVTDETVRNREAAGELFSILRPGRKRGREYPAFQAWQGVAGAPLKEILTALDCPSGPVAYYCCYRLSLLGCNVMPTARNARGVDIVAYSADASRFVGNQVKALSKRNPVPLGKSLDKVMGDCWVIINRIATQPTAFVLRPQEVVDGAHRGDKDGEVSYWLQPTAYDRDDFREAWSRIGHGGLDVAAPARS